MRPSKYFLYAQKSPDEDDRQILPVESQLTEFREFARKEQLVVAQEFTESMGRRKVENRGFEPSPSPARP
jgi:DNA invertase Pin-like site-specific DNA recombinase